MTENSDRDYALEGSDNIAEIPAPDLAYRPPRPQSYHPAIGLIGCGGITDYHLKAYQALGLNVTGFASRTVASATSKIVFPAGSQWVLSAVR